jgi:hypothetical protein
MKQKDFFLHVIEMEGQGKREKPAEELITERTS